MIRAALIGVSGFAGVHYNDLLREVEAGRMEAVAATIRHQEKEPEKGEKLRSLGCKLFADYREMLKQFRGQLDLCFIPTGIHLHAPMSIDAMRAGSNVFVEKPAAATVHDVLAMQAVERETGKFVAVGYQDMYGEDVRAIKRTIIEGRIGRIRSISGMGMWPRLDSYYARNVWAGRLQVGEHIVLDSPFNNALAHYLNMMLFFAGRDERVACTPRSVLAELFRAHDIESCDTACLRIETEEGTRLHFLVTHCSAETVGPLIRVKGEKGTLEWERSKPTPLRFADGRVEELPMEDMTIQRKRIMDHVIARVHDPTVFICTLDIAGVQTLCANAAHQSCAISAVPAAYVNRVPEGHSVKTVIVGIDDVFRQAFESDTLLSESGAPWATGLKARPVEASTL